MMIWLNCLLRALCERAWGSRRQEFTWRGRDIPNIFLGSEQKAHSNFRFLTFFLSKEENTSLDKMWLQCHCLWEKKKIPYGKTYWSHIPFPEKQCGSHCELCKGTGLAQSGVLCCQCTLSQFSNGHLGKKVLYLWAGGRGEGGVSLSLGWCKYILPVGGPFLCAGGGELGREQGNDSSSLFFSVGDVQISCYHILCSLYSLGTGKNIYVER